MLTPRGWWFLVFLIAMLIVSLGGVPLVLGVMPRGLAPAIPVLATICLTLLAWFFGNWLFFVYIARSAQSRFVAERSLSDERGELRTLWARQTATVSVTLTCPDGWPLPHVSATDRVPVLASRRAGELHGEGPLDGTRSVAFSYRIECPAPGRLRFDGVRIRITDLQGFFVSRLFLRDLVMVRVLPPLADARGHIPSVKRHNLLPLVGTHPHRRAGSGSELLDLRDYLPGDPPKMIAWKASARRQRLMTKVLESEVPIRCTLFVDTSNSTRIGPVGKNALARLLEISSAVIQANARARDLTGLCVFDEDGVTRDLRPGRGARHIVRAMRALADAGDLFPRSPGVPLGRLIAMAYAVIQDVYPDYLEKDLNAFPVWLPIWSPRPAYTVPEPISPRGSGWTWPLRWLWLRFRETPLAFHRWRTHARLIPYYHRLYRWRKQVAAVLSVHFGLDPGGLATMLEDDELCRHFIEEFLAEHQTPCPQLLYDRQGHYLFSAPRKLAVVADALLAAIRRGRDNELFVLLVDFLEAGPDLERVVQAVRVARGKHHEVIVICPWPAGVPLPDKNAAPRADLADRAELPTLQEAILRGSTARVHQAFAKVRQAFARMGVTVHAAPEETAVSFILHRMQRLRVFQRGVR